MLVFMWLMESNGELRKGSNVYGVKFVHRRYARKEEHRDASSIAVANGVLVDDHGAVDPEKYRGYVLIFEDLFYIIPGGKIGEPLPSVKMMVPSKPVRESVECSFCVNNTSETSEDHPDYIGGGRRTLRVRSIISELDLSSVQGRFCHTMTGPGLIEIYPDVVTRLETLRLATASRSNPCFYTDDGIGKCFQSQGRQTFLLMRHQSLSLVNCVMIKSHKRLTSGQCIYYWSSGWHPYHKENVKIGGVISFGRKIGSTGLLDIANLG
ncbi:hypothetical protein WH47_02492 [Habropoda laboriosa]|uniref:Uncharacterized protein n=1 Tax=Habropoda laboriosa TaxID=597456 RepID=A0A0L7QYI3_9HYME|nr:hypothetical protein WH47_02492 [Habropoda laboriosa]